MSTIYSQQYPDNIVPQIRSQKPSEPLPCLTCPPDNSLQAIIIDNKNLVVIKGWEWRSNISLNDFFQPIDNYAEYQIILPAGETTTLTYNPIANASGNVNFVMLFPQYHTTNIELQSDWKMKWRTSGSSADYNPLGRILMLSGTSDIGVQPIEIVNTAPADVEIKILIAI